MTGKKKIVFAAAFAAIVGSATGIAVAQEHGSAEQGANEHAAAEPGAQSGEHRAAVGEHGGHHGPEPINWTDIWDKRRPAFVAIVVNFGILAGLYYALGKKPIAAGLKQRRITIGKDIEDAQKLLAEAKERAAKYQGDLKNVDADAATAKATLVAAGKGEAERAIQDAEERADRMKRDAERLVDQERKQLLVDLQRETVDLAVAEAAKLLEKTVTPQDHARLADELLAELARRPAARAAGGAS